nr:integrase, catalytic region, zinc finger, CCHC-type, peptidase aspartic, catalytic [Tanacetum cinerariifolium]
MISEPGDVNRDVNVTETFHLQIDDELSDKELKQIEADDQAIQTILLGLPEDIYAAKEVDELKAERLAKFQDPLALMENSNNPYVFPAPHQDQSSFNQNYLQQPMLNPEDITNPTTVMNMALALIDKAFKLDYSTPTNNNQRISSNPMNRQIAQPGNPAGYNDVIENQNAVQNPRVQNVGNQNGLIGVQGNRNQNQIRNGNLVAARAGGNAAGKNGNQIRCYNCRGVGHYARNCTVRPRRRDAAYLQTQLLITQKEEAGIQLQAEEYDLMATDSTPIYDTDGSAEVHENYDDQEIFNMFTQEELYTELLEPIPESHQVPQNDNDVIFEDTSMEQEQKMALGYQNPFYLKQAQKKQQSLYDGKVLLAKHDPPVVHDSEETLQLAQESRDKMKQMNKEIKPANYTKINHLSGVFVSQTALSREELYFSNNSKTANVLKSFLIPNEDLSDDTTPSVVRKFLNEVKSTIVTLQRVVKQRMTIETHNSASSAHQELHKIIRDENFPIVNQVDARLQNFQIQFLKEAAKFIGDFKSLANEVDASLAKHKALELEIKRLLKAVVSDQKDNTHDTSKNTKFAKQPIVENLPKVGKTNALSKPVTSNSVFTPQESKGVNNDKVIAPGMFKINPSKTSREEKHVPNTVSASARTKPITVAQPHVITKKDVNSDLNGLSFIGVDNTKTRRPQSRSNTKHDRVPTASKSSRSQNKEAEVEEHHRNLLLSKNNKHISSACNNIKIDSQDVISKVVCAMCKKCLIFVNHDKYLSNSVNGKNSCGKNQKAKVSVKEIQKKYQPKVTKPKKLRTRQLCDSDLEAAFRRNVCFIRTLEGVDLLKGDRSTNLYTINLHEMASACLI